MASLRKVAREAFFLVTTKGGAHREVRKERKQIPLIPFALFAYFAVSYIRGISSRTSR